MFGPSIKSIADTELDVDAWLAEQAPRSYTDFDGGRIDLDPTEEEQFAYQRRGQLRELMDMRRPVGREWAWDMRFGDCCR